MKERTYVCCDLKSFYASVECVERGLDPMTTNLVVADQRRTEKTICLAVSPSLKAYGIAGRARLFEVVQKVAEVNARRRERAPSLHPVLPRQGGRGGYGRGRRGRHRPGHGQKHFGPTERQNLRGEPRRRGQPVHPAFLQNRRVTKLSPKPSPARHPAAVY